MQELDDETYEEIRGVAARNWMHGASVSLAHLDQVKATKYNLGLTDPTSLKAVGKNAAIFSAKSNSQAEVENIETAPPISKLSIQQNAWGSTASVPDLIKQHTERQRLPKSKRAVRPESAKVKSYTKLPRGKRIRPQSAKDMNLYDAENTQVKPKINIGVHGVRYDVSDRLLEGSSVHSSMSSGWMVPPGVTDVTNKAIGSTINRFMDLDSKMSSPCLTDVEEGPPPPPRGSPDFLHMVASDPNSEENFVNAVDDMIENHGHGCQDEPGRSPRQLLRRPTPEPIRFALPNADEDYDSDPESKKVPCDFEPNENKSAMDQNESDVMRDLTLDLSKVKVETRIVEIKLINPYSADEPETLVGGPEKSKKELHINEDENITLQISPREGNRKSRPHRPYSGRKELRYVKSRTDSGMSTTGGDSGKPSRPSSGKQPISKINVAYLSDSDSEGELLFRQTSKQRGVKEGAHDTSDEELPGDDMSDDRPGSRPGSPSKQISGPSQNYYQLAWQGRPGHGATEEVKPKTITTKTLALLGDHERTVSETKTVHVIDTTKVTKPKEYIAPRPPSAMRRQPSVRPQSAKTAKQPKPDLYDQVQRISDKAVNARVEVNNAKNAAFLKTDLKPDIRNKEKAINVNNNVSSDSSGNKPVKENSSEVQMLGDVNTTTHSAKPESSTKDQKVPRGSREPLTCVALSKQLEESAGGRPDSRLGYNEENLNSMEASDRLGILKKRRVTSAPPSRLTGAGSQNPELRFNLGRIRPHSAKDDSGKKPHCSNHLTDHNHNRSYATYGHSSAMSHKPRSQPQEVNEIWTRREDFTMETEGVKECRQLQDKLIEAGVPITLETLKRGLLPPTEYGFSSPAVKTEIGPSLTPNYSSGLLSKPEFWLAAEYKKLKEAEKKVRQATASLLEQEREERRRAESASTSSEKKKKKKKKGKSKKGKSKSAQT